MTRPPIARRTQWIEGPGYHFITILLDDPETELAVVIHRSSDEFPLEGPVAARKAANADMLVALINDHAHIQEATP